MPGNSSFRYARRNCRHFYPDSLINAVYTSVTHTADTHMSQKCPEGKTQVINRTLNQDTDQWREEKKPQYTHTHTHTHASTLLERACAYTHTAADAERIRGAKERPFISERRKACLRPSLHSLRRYETERQCVCVDRAESELNKSLLFSLASL